MIKKKMLIHVFSPLSPSVNHSHACTMHTALTICARRYIWAWLAVRVEAEVFPSSTACWVMLAGAELTLWARLMSWAAAAGEVARLICFQRSLVC